MNIKVPLALAGVLSLILVAIPVLGHHSFAAQFDRNKPANLTGPVTKIEWINPHARFFMDVKEADGRTVNWEIELGSTAGLLRRGWTRNSLKIGQTVTIAGSKAKDGSNVANASTVTLSDGKRVFAGSSGDDPNTQ
jgi:hypothetical protein